MADEPPRALEGGATATKTAKPAGDGEKATPTATPSTQAGASGVVVATGQEEEVKAKRAEKKSEVSRPLMSRLS